jgi:hypothetical protein
MPWRFRKRKKLFPGVTLNLSDKGAGVTVGNRGGRVSVNSSGRTTVGASVPGTGIYFQETVSSGKRGAPATAPASAGGGCLRKVLVWGGGALAVLFGASMLASLAPRSAPTVERAGDVVITAAPVVVETTATVAPTMAQAVVEVTVAPSATPLPTATPAPVDTPTAIPTVIPTVAAGAVVIEAANVREGPGVEYAVVIGAQPGQAVVVTGRDASGEWLQLGSGYWIAAALVANAPVDLPVTAAPAQLPGGNPTAAPVVVEATPVWETEQNGVIFRSDCPCDQGNVLNCGDFGIDMDAQGCYLRCMALVGNDVHELDRDKDGGACEWSW